MTEQLSWRLNVEGAQVTQQKLAQVNQSFQALDQQSRGLTSRFSGVATAGSALGTALSRMNPELGSLVTAFGSAGGAASGLTTAIGGIGGLLGGGLVAAIGVAIQYFVNANRESKALTEQYQAQAQTVDTLVSSYRELEKAAAKASRASMGAETVSDLEELLANKQLELKEAKDYLVVLNQKSQQEKVANSDAIGSLNHKIILLGKEEEALLRNLNTRKAQAATWDAEETHTETMWDLETKRAAAAEKSAADAARRAMAAQRKAEEAQKLEDEEFRRRMDVMVSEIDEKRFIEEEKARIDEEAKWGMSEREQELANYRMQLAEDYIRKTEAEERAHQKKMQSMYMGHLNTVGSAMGSVLSDVAAGRKVEAGMIISMIGDQMIAKGTMHLMEALAMAWIPGLQGNAGGLAAAGTAEIVAGMAFGAAGAAASGGGGGGAGGSATSASYGSGGAASPTPAQKEEEDRSQPIVVNVHTLRADEEAGRAIMDSLEQYQDRHGKSASMGRFV